MIRGLLRYKQTNVRVAVVLSVSTLLLSGCLTQNPVPVTLKGEEFFGDESSSEVYRYRLIKDDVGGGSSRSSGLENSKILVQDISSGESSPSSVSASCGFSMPADGKVVHNSNKKNSGKNYCSDGVAIFSDTISQIRASADGKVLYVGKDLQRYGNLVIVEHDKYTVTMYYNLDIVTAKIGSQIKRGEPLGVVSVSTPGKSDGYFFCFAMRKNGEPVDPVAYMQKC